MRCCWQTSIELSFQIHFRCFVRRYAKQFYTDFGRLSGERAWSSISIHHNFNLVSFCTSALLFNERHKMIIWNTRSYFIVRVRRHYLFVIINWFPCNSFQQHRRFFFAISTSTRLHGFRHARAYGPQQNDSHFGKLKRCDAYTMFYAYLKPIY